MWQVIIGVVLGFALGLIPLWWVRRRRLLGHWRVLRVEIEACCRFAQTLLAEPVQSPLYRLPVLSYEICYPSILAEGAPTEPEISTLTKFFGHVLEVNRGLDNADEWLKIGDDGKLKRERDRINLKAGKIVPTTDAQPGLHAEALAIAIKYADALSGMTDWQYVLAQGSKNTAAKLVHAAREVLWERPKASLLDLWNRR